MPMLHGLFKGFYLSQKVGFDSAFLSGCLQPRHDGRRSRACSAIKDGANLLVLKTRQAQLRHEVNDQGTISAFGKPIISCTHIREKAMPWETATSPGEYASKELERFLQDTFPKAESAGGAKGTC
ncbi:Hypothetical predicted protein [Prunus dulcis]|uniref:Uncharacterized protein n=1 Tax=Prunus dulcis TaxID=3755 RepID=A0A5E4FS27_PRUDU|nr:Hypothetical predicted protein [Prunus dulcis]